MKHILFLSLGEFFPYQGGIARYVESLLASLPSTTHKTIFAPFLKEASSYNRTNTNVIRPHITRYTVLQIIISWWYIGSFLLKIKPDLLIITDQLSLKLITRMWWLFQMISPRTKCVLIVYGTELLDIKADEGYISNKELSAASKYIHYIVVISDYVKQLLATVLPQYPKEQILLLYPTVDEAFLATQVSETSQTAILERFQLTSHKYMLSTGRLVKRKGHKEIISYLKKIRATYPDFKYLIIGKGPEKETILQSAKKHGVAHALVIASDCTEADKKILVQNCLFYLHPSKEFNQAHQRTEGFGIAIIEAFSQRKTVITTQHGGISEIVTDAQNGLFISLDDQEKSLRTFISLIEDASLRETLEKNALRTYIENFSPRIFQDTVSNHIQEISKKTIAFVVEWFYPIIGGAGHQALTLAQNLSQYRVIFLTKQVENASTHEYVQGFQTFRFGGKHAPTSKTHDYKAAYELFNWLKQHRNMTDLIHIHGNIENNFAFAAVLFSKLFRKKSIAKLAIAGELRTHLESEQYSAFQQLIKSANPLNWIRRYMARKADHYIAISKAIQQELSAIGITRDTIRFIPNGVNTDFYKPATSDERLTARKKLQFKPEDTIFLTVSRLARHKGIISPLLDAWKNLYSNTENYHLVIVGSGEKLSSSVEKEIYEFVQHNNLRNVHIMGRTQQMLAYYQAADIFILPSENEGLSNALLEACSAGLIPIVSDISGNTDVILNNQTGYIFKKGHTTSLIGSIENAIQHTSEWHSMKEKLRNTIISKYSIQHTAHAVEKLYEKLCE